jgi:hypothetical protein
MNLNTYTFYVKKYCGELKCIQNNVGQLACGKWIDRVIQIRSELQDSFVLFINLLGFVLLLHAGVGQYTVSSSDSCS